MRVYWRKVRRGENLILSDENDGHEEELGGFRDTKRGIDACALITVIPIIALILSIAACQGAGQGPPGPQGSSGAPGPAGPPGPAGAPALVDEATVASLIEQIQEQLDTGYATATVPPKSTPADYTKFLVRDAISRYESEGLVLSQP